jgi:hypothetical protein
MPVPATLAPVLAPAENRNVLPELSEAAWWLKRSGKIVLKNRV